MAGYPVARTRAGITAGLSGVLLLAGSVIGTAGAQEGEQQQGGQQQGEPAPQASAEMMDSNGGTVGRVQVREFPQGTLFVVELDSLPPGAHGFHIHERGTCNPPDFESARDHYSPLDNSHGFANPRGYHGGDLPNVHANANGWVRAEFFAHHLVITSDRGRAAGGDADESSAFAPEAPGPFELLDDNGAAIVVHENPDDYRSEDSAGGRIACGVIEPSEGGGQGG